MQRIAHFCTLFVSPPVLGLIEATKVTYACYILQQSATCCNQKDELIGQMIENIDEV